jgi:glycosyltransferase involved in cell wall biosynthesis
MPGHRWIVVADSPCLPAQGGGEKEHVGLMRAAARAGWLALLIVPGAAEQDIPAYQRELGDVPVIVTPRRTSALLLAHPTKPFVVASRPVPRWLVARAHALAPDATAVIVSSYKSHDLGEALARGLGLPAVLRHQNREGTYHRSLAAGTPGPRGLALRWEAWRIERDERALGRADWLAGTADISAADAAWRRSTGAHGVVHVPPFAIDLGDPGHDPDAAGPAAQSAPGDEVVPRVLFLGAMDVATNTDAIAWLTERVWPRIAAAHPTVRLDVVGRRPSPELRRRLAAIDRVDLAADVPRIQPYLDRASVAVNPAVSGSGVNIKLVEYLDAGVPLVSTSLATRGLPLQPGVHLEIQDQPDGFADAVLALLADPEAARATAKRGQAFIRDLLDARTNLDRLATMLGEPVEGR